MTDRHSLPSRTPAIRMCLALLALGLAADAAAQTVYKCTDGHGNVAFQDAPCRKDARQHVMHLHVPTPPPDAPAAAAPANTAPRPPAPSAVAAPPAPAPPTYEIPQLYSCLRATDGKNYVSRNGDPPAYRAPLGILGAFQMPLSQTYGGRDAARRAASDPQLAKGRITPGLVADHYAWVQDQCQPMNVEEICAYLATQLDQTQTAIDKAFKSDQPPLEAKAAALRRDMAGCAR